MMMRERRTEDLPAVPCHARDSRGSAAADISPRASQSRTIQPGERASVRALLSGARARVTFVAILPSPWRCRSTMHPAAAQSHWGRELDGRLKTREK
ncbi:unnamed protein product [Lampetra planeri]